MNNEVKRLRDLTLLDRFLFSAAMDDPDFAKDVFSIIMEDETLLQTLPQTEKEQRNRSLRKYVRLDVWARDEEDQIFDAEVQKENTYNLPKRSRYYQAMIDSNLLEVGDTDYNKMNTVYVIMITPFDLFGKGLYRYSFDMRCGEDDSVCLGDGAMRIFLNTRGTKDASVSEELKNLLRFFESPTEEAALASGSRRIQNMYKRVESLKKNEELGAKFMREWEEKILAEKQAREKGLAEGRAEGLSQGRAEGLSQGRAEGLVEGREIAITQLSVLIQKLLQENKLDEIAKVTESESYREQMLREYGLQKEITTK